MPLYEFHCNTCDEEFELILRFAESSRIPACPKCFSSRTQKKISTVIRIGARESSSYKATSTNSGSCGSSSGFS